MSNRKHSSILAAALCIHVALGVSVAHAASSLTRTVAYDYDAASGLLRKEIVEPGYSDLCVVTEHQIDPWGQRIGTRVRNCNGSAGSVAGAAREAGAPGLPAAFAARNTLIDWTGDHRFVARTTNPMGHVSTQSVDGRWGLPSAQVDANGLAVQWAYDGLGRKVLEKRADGTGTRFSHDYCAGVAGGALPCPVVMGVPARYAITATPIAGPIDLSTLSSGPDNGAFVRTYFDLQGREIRTETEGFDATGVTTPVYVDTRYKHHRPWVAGKTQPYFAGQAAYWTQFNHDALGRVVTEYRPTDSGTGTLATYISYDGLSTTTTDPLRRRTTVTRDVSGQVVSVTDPQGNVLRSSHDPAGQLVRSQDALGNVTSTVYDALGRRIAQHDPDLGSWAYTVDALGQLVAQRDAKGQVTTFGYDVLGRVVSRNEPSLNSTWSHDRYADGSACPRGIGKLCEVGSANGYRRRVAYDTAGRASSTTTSVGTTFISSVSYDVNGRLSTTSYPTGLTVQYVYTPRGYLQYVVDTRTGIVLWRTDAMDASARVTRWTYGNGVVNTREFHAGTGRLSIARAGAGNSVLNLSHVFDDAGQLAIRVDSTTGVSATYGYDSLGRLTEETRAAGGACCRTIAWAYDAIGNMNSRTEDGLTNTYHYNTSGLGSLRPHAVAGVSGTVDSAVAPSYAYDANGNLVSGGRRNVSWTSFDKVNTVSRGEVSVEYLYGAGHERAQELLRVNGSVHRTTVYLNPGAGAGLAYEDETGVAGARKKHYLSAGGEAFGMIVCMVNPCTNPANTSTQYWHKDHLGSTAATTDASGAVVERLVHEPFGKRRRSDGLTDRSGSVTAHSTDRGFTGHEHVDELGLINMNGRVYDPALGRFMSPDPFVQDTQSLQSHNRYSYVWNNPMNGTDPTGYYSDHLDDDRRENINDSGQVDYRIYTGPESRPTSGGFGQSTTAPSLSFPITTGFDGKGASEAGSRSTMDTGWSGADYSLVPGRQAGRTDDIRQANVLGLKSEGSNRLKLDTGPEHLKFSVGNQQFVINGGNAWERRDAERSTRDVMSTQAGRQMLDHLEERGKRFFIDVGNSGERGPFGYYNMNYVIVDGRIRLVSALETGEARISLTRQIAHEFGHAVFGTKDDGVGMMNNVHQHENVIMRELGGQSRTSYVGRRY
jgi:RHS repeat-associated protein